MRYSCIAAEPVPQDTRPSDLEGISDQLLNIAPHGSYAIRLVCRMLILHQSGKILQEDWCVTPLPSSHLQVSYIILVLLLYKYTDASILIGQVSHVAVTSFD